MNYSHRRAYQKPPGAQEEVKQAERSPNYYVRLARPQRRWPVFLMTSLYVSPPFGEEAFDSLLNHHQVISHAIRNDAELQRHDVLF